MSPGSKGGALVRILVVIVLTSVAAYLYWRNYYRTEVCVCEHEPKIYNNDLIIQTKKQWTWTGHPAKISVLFKVDQKLESTEDGETKTVIEPVTDLKGDNFRLRENGEIIPEYESRKTKSERTKKFSSNIMLLLDLSGSVTKKQKNMEALTKGLGTFIISLLLEDRTEYYGKIGIFWFDGRPDIQELADFTDDGETLLNKIGEIGGELVKDHSTNLFGAVAQGMKKASGLGGTADFVVIFTDGKDHADLFRERDALRAVSKVGKNVSVCSIGFMPETAQSVKKTLVNIGGKQALFAYGADQLEDRFREIAVMIQNEIKSYYLVEYCSPKRKGIHKLKIFVDYKNKSGALETCFCANGFRGGCVLAGE